MKYRIYQVGKIPPLTEIEAEKLQITDKQILLFKDKYANDVGVFNWDNIAGVEIVER